MVRVRADIRAELQRIRIMGKDAEDKAMALLKTVQMDPVLNGPMPEPCPGCLKMARVYMVEVLSATNDDSKAWYKASVIKWQKRSLTCAGKMGNHATHDGAIDDAAKDRNRICADAPIADPVERAKAVASALRSDGIDANVRDGTIECAQWPGWGFDVSKPGNANTGIVKIVDEIKSLLIARAKSKAGDT